MGLFEILLLSISLAMDAFAVSIAAGIGSPNAGRRTAATIALFFGGFQTLMPIIGYLAAGAFYGYICHFDHWIAFVLLAFIGGKMIYEAVANDACTARRIDLGLRSLLILALATSIDALAAGVGLTFLCASIWLPAATIGMVTCALCFIGFLFGKRLGCAFGKRMEIAGGVVLVGLGLKILLESLLG
ncbi:MAG TPA: manganese efflux pump MntP family protein [bacterium]|nr:manganese efflux pump MntP family protein [bacterium]